MERTFFPRWDYWFAFQVNVCGWSVILGGFCFLTQLEGEPGKPAKFRWHTSAALWCSLAVGAAYFAAATLYGVLAYRRKRLMIREDEIRCYEPLFVRTIRFADVIKAWWIPHIDRTNPQPRGIKLRSAKKKLEIDFDHFVSKEAQDELIDFFRRRLGPSAWHDWEKLQAIREGRASPWGPPAFTLKRMPRLLAVVAVLSVLIGAALGLLLQIRFPGGAEWWARATNSRFEISPVRPWFGSLPLDWGLGFGLAGLVIGILFLSFFWFLEWSGRKCRTIQGRRSERARYPPAPGPIQPPPDSRSG